MPALNYKNRFVALVQTGLKPHSIRAWRKQRPFRKGDTLMHYTAMRTVRCQKVRRDTRCIAASPIWINSRRRQVKLGGLPSLYPFGNLSQEWIGVLAVRDGFDSVEEFFAFFQQPRGRSFTGQLIEWKF